MRVEGDEGGVVEVEGDGEGAVALVFGEGFVEDGAGGAVEFSGVVFFALEDALGFFDDASAVGGGEFAVAGGF